VNRGVELLLALVIGLLLALPLLLIALAVKLTSRGPVLYWSQRVGQDNRLFDMPKFRTMRLGTPSVATHLLGDARSVLTPIGGFLRKTSLDEIPQLWSILAGDMRFVGPRPALFNQDDLIALRTEAGVHRLRPGVTGWAQVKGRDALTIPEKVALDREYLLRRSFGFDMQIILRTVGKVFGDRDVAH
jgi:O-antigen biosynthesis protein WbqP